MNRVILLILIFTVLPSQVALALSKPKYRAFIPSSLAPPFLLSPNNPEGLAKDYTDAIADELHAEVTVSLLPRKRVDEFAANAKYDFNCHTNEIWNDRPDLFYWSDALFHINEVVVAETTAPSSLDQLMGKTIGTIIGYKYPKLAHYFSSGKMIREDAANSETNINKLLRKRVQFIVIEEPYLNHYQKKNPGTQVSKNHLILDRFPVKCALSRRSRLSLDKLNKAIAKVKSSGKLDQLFAKYE